MEIIWIIIALILVVALNVLGFWYFAYLFKKKLDEENEKTKDPFLMLQSQLEQVRETIDKKLFDTTAALDKKLTDTTALISESLQKQLAQSANIVKEVTRELEKLSQTNQQVVGFANQLQRLQETLTNPKQRGVLGEYYLEAVLQNVLPPHSYKMQYPLAGGSLKVDAALFVKDKVIPVDAKFSLENYNRMLEAKTKEEKEKYQKEFKKDIKQRIDETAKYIRPQDGTVEFAFMFVPSEGVYYDLLMGSVGTGISARDLIEYAFSKKVLIVSPTTFFAYLQTVLQGLKMLEIEKSAKEIIKRVEILGKHIEKYQDSYNKLGKSIAKAVSEYNQGYKQLAYIDKDVLKITGSSAGIKPEVLEKPALEE